MGVAEAEALLLVVVLVTLSRLVAVLVVVAKGLYPRHPAYTDAQ